MGVPWVLASEAQVEAFRRDWLEHGLTLAEMAAMHGFRNVNGVSRAAQRLGLPKRRGGRPKGSAESPRVLARGAWVLDPRRRVLVWTPEG